MIIDDLGTQGKGKGNKMAKKEDVKRLEQALLDNMRLAVFPTEALKAAVTCDLIAQTVQEFDKSVKAHWEKVAAEHVETLIGVRKALAGERMFQKVKRWVVETAGVDAAVDT